MEPVDVFREWAEKLIDKDSDAAIAKYMGEHQNCPECKSGNIKLWPNFNKLQPGDPDYKNENRVLCISCGWKGIVHGLIPGK